MGGSEWKQSHKAEGKREGVMVAGGEAEVFEVFGGKQELVHERGDCGERGGRAGGGRLELPDDLEQRA